MKAVGMIIVTLLVIGVMYVLTLCFPQPFYPNILTVNNISIYSDEEIPTREMTDIIHTVEDTIRKSALYKADTKHSIYITANPVLWTYFTNKFNKVGGLNYTLFNHSIFLRKADIRTNRLYGPSGNPVAGDRTLDYFMAHEITHTLEFQSMPWHRYPINTNWTLEGYAEYIAHGSQTYEASLEYYLTVPENAGAKNYTRMRTMVAYVLEKEKVPISELWGKVNEYDRVLKAAIPNNKPKIIDSGKF